MMTTTPTMFSNTNIIFDKWTYLKEIQVEHA